MNIRRKGLYGAPPLAPPAGEPSAPPPVEPLRGARAVGEDLHIPVKQVYRLLEAKRAGRDADPIPVNDVPVLGLCADKATLLRWWARKLGATTAA
jgi:hypothetical protein